MANIGNLFVNLGLNSAEFQAGVKKATAQTNSMEKKMRGSFSRIKKDLKGLTGGMLSYKGILTALGAGSMIAFIKTQIDAADRLQKLSEITGIAVENLSKYGQIAELGGTSSEDMMNAVIKLSKNMQDSLITTTSASAIAFKQMGINVVDSNGKLREADDVMHELAGKFAKMHDGSQKTAIAVSLFGRSGAQIIPTLNSLNDEMGKVNATISTDFANASAAFNDQITRMKAGMQGTLGTGKSATAMLRGLTYGLTWVSDKANTLATGFSELGTIIGGVASAISASLSGEFSRARRVISDMNDDIAQMEKERLAASKKIWDEYNNPPPPPKKPGGKKGGKGYEPGAAEDYSTSSAKGKLQAQIDNLTASLATEEEAIQASYERRQTIIQEALAKNIISQKKASELIARSEKAKEKALSNAAKKGALERFGLAKVAALKEAAIKAKQSIIDAFQYGTSMGGPPVGFLMAAIAGVYQAKLLSDLGGGGLGIGGGGKGGGHKKKGGNSSAPASPSSSITSNGEANARKEHTIVLEGVDPGKTFSAEQVRELTNRIASTLGGEAAFAK
jgi:hypothetical protein